MKRFDLSNWDPMKEDFMKNKKAVENVTTPSLMNGGSVPVEKDLYIKNVPINMTADTIKSIIKPYAEPLMVKIGKPNEISLKTKKVYAIAKVPSLKCAFAVIEGVGGKPPLYLGVELSHDPEERERRKQKQNLLSDIQYEQPSTPVACEKEVSSPRPLKPSSLFKLCNLSKTLVTQDNTKSTKTVATENSLVEGMEKENCEIQENVGLNIDALTNGLVCIRCKFIGLKRCSICKASYCSIKCQTDDWFSHQFQCRSPPDLEDHPLSEETHRNEVNKSNYNSVSQTISDKPNNDLINTDVVDRGIVPEIKGVQINELNHQPDTNSNKNQDDLNKIKVCASACTNNNFVKTEPDTTDYKFLCDRIKKATQAHKIEKNSVQTNVKAVKFSIDSSHSKPDNEMKENIASKLAASENKEIITGIKPLEETAISNLISKESYLCVISYKESLQNFSLVIHNENLNALVTVLSSERLSGGNIIDCSSLSVNDIVAAQSPTDNAWYRAKIVNLNEGCEVLYIDYGNMEVVQSIRSLPMDADTTKVHGLAVRATPFGSLSSEIANELNKHIQQDVSIKILVQATKSTSIKAMLLTKSGEELTPYILKPWETVEFTPKEREESSNTRKIEPVKKEEVVLDNAKEMNSNKKFYSKQLKYQTIENGKEYDVVVTYFSIEKESVSLQVATGETSALLHGVISAVQNHCQTAAQASNMEKEELICAFVETDQCWYRGKILEVLGKQVNVHFLDFGNSDFVEAKNVKVFNIHLLSTPVLCHDVKPIGFKECTNAVEIVTKCMDETHICKMQVTSLQPLKAFFKTPTGKDLFPIPAQIKDKSIVKSNGPVEASKLLMEGTYKPKLLMYSDCENVKLPIKKGVSVFVLNSKDPLNLFVTPTENSQLFEAIEVLTEKINSYCKSIPSTYYVPSEGEVCLAKYSSDENWYRAACLQVNETNAIVAFTDNGDLQIVEFDSLCQMVDKFLEVPHIAVHCIVKGFTIENVQEGGTELRNKFQELVPNDRVMNVDVLSYDEENFVYVVEFPSINLSQLISH